MADFTSLMEALPPSALTRLLQDPDFAQSASNALEGEVRGLADELRKAKVDGPRVIILPGFMGSKLGHPNRWRHDGEDRIWVDIPGIAFGELGRMSTVHLDVFASGYFYIAYLRMHLKLRAMGIDAQVLPYDWRLGSRTVASQLYADVVAGGEVTLVGHSYGGRIARALAGLDPEGEKITKVITVGTPHFGSYSTVDGISGTASMLEVLAAIDLTRSEADIARTILRGFPAILEMLPQSGLSDAENYFDLAKWPAEGIKPGQRLLEAARIEQKALHAPDDRFQMIVGNGRRTQVSAKPGVSTFDFSYTNDGDGTVPLRFALYEGFDPWFTGASHPFQCNDDAVIDAVADLIRTGTTQALSTDPERPTPGGNRPKGQVADLLAQLDASASQ